jgi:DNA-binding IclR family transcriptional regulator
VLKTVDRALQLLLSFEEADQEYRVGELAAMLGVDKSVASRLAATLTQRGFLERAPENGAFRLGPELGRLGLLATSSRHSLVALAQRSMERLAAEAGETAYLAVLEDKKVVNIAQVEGHYLVGVGDWVGWRTEPHCTANGKVLLAFADGKIDDLTLEAFTERTITSADDLRSELEVVAVPIFDASEFCRAALSVTGPSYRMPPARLPELAELCNEAALEIGTRLGREHEVS